MPSPSGRDRRWLLRGCVALGSAIIGVLLIYTAVARPSVPEPPLAESAPEPSVRATPSVQPKPTARASSTKAGQKAGRRVIPDRITGQVLPESDPVVVAIPRIGVRSRLVRLGLEADGELQVPKDPAQAGWFTGGAAPGALGPSVIAGHVTWNGVPGVFYRLGAMRPGDQVTVIRKDGRTAVFTVNRVAQFPKSRFPTNAVYGAINHAGLRLITCGGTYDAARHRYLANVVVFARLSAVHPSHDR